MLKLSKKAEYALMAAKYMALKNSSGYSTAKEISESYQIPHHLVAKVLQNMVKSELANSAKGTNGGFSLARPAKEIYLQEVVKAIDGDDVFSRCVLHNDNCKSTDHSKVACALHGDYVKQRSRIEKLFETKSVYNLVSTARNSDDILI